MSEAALGAELWSIVEGESVLYRRPGTGWQKRLAPAVRRPAPAGAVKTGSEGLLCQEVFWHLPVQEDWQPQPGDQIVSSEGRRWTVLEVQLLAHGSRWRLRARDLVLAAGLDRQVTIEILHWEKNPDGTPARRWRIWKSAVRAAVRPWRAVDAKSPRRSYERRLQVVLEECPPTDSLVRLRTPAGRILQVLSVHAPRQVDELPWIEAVELP